jgi:MarR family transcriptional regulator, organic hydroperoxide resistance regulator
MKPDLPPTVSRATLLVNGRDEVFRALITDLLAFGDALRDAREEIAAALGVSAPQYAILMAIARSPAHGGPGVSEVGATLRVSVPFIVGQTRALVAAGFLRKKADPADRRRVRLVLTPSCRTALTRLASFQRRVNDALFAGIGATEFRALQKTLRKLAATLAIAPKHTEG